MAARDNPTAFQVAADVGPQDPDPSRLAVAHNGRADERPDPRLADGVRLCLGSTRLCDARVAALAVAAGAGILAFPVLLAYRFLLFFTVWAMI